MIKLEHISQPPTEAQLYHILNTIDVVMKPPHSLVDKRKCVLCQEAGDTESDGPGRYNIHNDLSVPFILEL